MNMNLLFTYAPFCFCNSTTNYKLIDAISFDVMQRVQLIKLIRIIRPWKKVIVFCSRRKFIFRKVIFIRRFLYKFERWNVQKKHFVFCCQIVLKWLEGAFINRLVSSAQWDGDPLMVLFIKWQAVSLLIMKGLSLDPDRCIECFWLRFFWHFITSKNVSFFKYFWTLSVVNFKLKHAYDDDTRKTIKKVTAHYFFIFAMFTAGSSSFTRIWW